ncbi:restriction endonuclease [Thioclava sp. F36-7]|uniref:restriction endonuclease n=1 Tax=Thioclava sp. F36-7 TaxID=1915317 RepID=UPI0009989C5F|nr:restriction endonuclease [Thioclava sp. F36-7]OOY09330.1 hypothetical protein BMI89_05800 [Thioclava sp. F36-7]
MRKTMPKLTKHQQQKIDDAWKKSKPEILTAVERHYGQLRMLLMEAEQDAIRLTPQWSGEKRLKEEKLLRKVAAIKSFLQENGFFTNQTKGIQNAALFVRAQKTIIAKSASLERQRKLTGFDKNSIPVDGYAFEYWVADSLRRLGWSVETTSGSGDQGIDVLATFRDRKLAIQCKRYSGSVGNKAIQEAYAGRAFYEADADLPRDFSSTID